MFNNRMLAVAAVLVMAVPALGAATPIVVPPVPEQLVEGHTVFTVIEIVKATTTTQSKFAAAVAVLVREVQSNRVAQRFPGVLWFNDQYLVNPTQASAASAAFRYPCGGAVMAVNAGDPDPRIAIARIGDAQNPVVNVNGATVVAGGQGIDTGDTTFGETNHTYDPTWTKPYPGTYYYGQDSGGAGDDPTDYAWVGAKPGDGTIDVTADQANPEQTGVTADGNMLYSDTVIGAIGGDVDGNLLNATAPWDYRESYLITDPNDHSWVIDKYEFYTRDSIDGANAHVNDIEADGDPTTPADGVDVDFAGDRAPGSDNVNNEETKLFVDPNDPDGDATTADPDGVFESEHYPADFPGAVGGQLQTVYTYPVWVVNVLGTPVFLPDGGNAINFGGEYVGENCMPFRDLLEDLTQPVNGAACGLAIDNAGLGTGADTDVTLSPGQPVAPFTDDPCMGYMEPSRNGYCYGGQAAYDADTDGDIDKDDCLATRADGNQFSQQPLRLYNALLYFKLEDLRVAGAARDHSDPVASTDTNGCSQEQYWWGPNPPHAADQYPCPAADDDQEGNSHPFHPSAPAHEERELCDPAFGGPNPTNHGGSTYIAADQRALDSGWYEGWTPCDYAHATRNIDIYFSPGGRPFPPTLRVFNVMDLEGSSAPFQDFHDAYPGVSP